MSTLNTVETLLSLSLNQLCQSMNEDTLQYALKSLTPSICKKIIVKVLGLDIYASRLLPVELGHKIAVMDYEPLQNFLAPILINNESFEQFANNHQALFVERFNFSSLFDHQLFFKLVGETSLRSHLLILFQICIQIKGFNFPLNFAQEWVNIETPDSNEGMCLPDIEKGLKLGIFLGDAGWLVESALVLSHTYEIITTKWVCHDKNVELHKTLQCLAKWLLVASNYYNFVEAKVVLQRLIYVIDLVEQIEGRTLSISYSYLAVSQYYYVLMEFDKAWFWAVKAILELHMASRDLKMLILSHSIKVCCSLYKFNIAWKLIKQLETLENGSNDAVIYVDSTLSNAIYLFNTESPALGSDFYYDAIGQAWTLFGYCNLNTAIILANYAFARHEYDRSELENYESLRCILQAIFIMQKIGVPNDNLLLVNALQIKSLMIQKMLVQGDLKFYIELEAEGTERANINEISMPYLLKYVEETYLFASQIALLSLGENNLLTAKSYCYLGTFYIYQKRYTESKKMYLKEIGIIKSILGTNNTEFAKATGHLTHLYTHHLRAFQEAEQLLLQTINIYESISDGPIREFESDIEGLIGTYKALNNMERFNYYINYLATVDATHDAWFYELQYKLTEENCTKIDLSLEKLKCILNGCSCG